jgi:hypothetical protein
MIARIMISLRKAARAQENRWIGGTLAGTNTNFQSAVFFKPRKGPNQRREDIPLDTYREPQVETQENQAVGRGR